MNSIKFLLIPLFLLIIISACSSEDNTVEPQTRYPNASAQNIDEEGLTNAFDILSGSTDTRWLLVERNGVIVQEEYFNGFTSDRFCDVRSVTKSVISVLIGIAIDKGYIQSVDETIEDYLGSILPDLDPAKGAISIRNLLTMSSGLPWHELGTTSGDFSSWVTSPDQLMWILNKPLLDPPGDYWNYNTGASHILSAILTAATGQTAKEFASQYLLGPLDGEVGDWSADSRGNNFGGHGINFRGGDMIKIGRMMLDGGIFNGEQIVSSEWVNESTEYYYNTSNAVPYGQGYSYLWWIGFDNVTGVSFFFAHGYGGQFIICIPEYNTVISAATRWSGAVDPNGNWYWVLSTLVGNILPALNN